MTVLATIIGNVVADVEPRISQAGKPWCNVRVACTPRERDRQSGEYKDGESMFVSIALFGEYADHAVQSHAKGTRLTASGKLRQRSYTDNQGVERVSVELYDVEAIGPDLRFATATVTKSGNRAQSAQNSWAAQTPTGGMNGAQNSSPQAFGGDSGGFDETF